MMFLCIGESMEKRVYIELEIPEPKPIPPWLTNNQKKSARRARELQGKNKGLRSNQEQLQYYQFLVAHLSYFEIKDNKRYDKVFKMMSSFIKTRTSDQCRTHHQKLEGRYKKLVKIVNSLKLQFGDVENSNNMEGYEEFMALSTNGIMSNTAFSSASKTSYITKNSEIEELSNPEDFYCNTDKLDYSIEFHLQEVDLFVTNGQQPSLLALLD